MSISRIVAYIRHDSPQNAIAVGERLLAAIRSLGFMREQILETIRAVAHFAPDSQQRPG